MQVLRVLDSSLIPGLGPFLGLFLSGNSWVRKLQIEGFLVASQFPSSAQDRRTPEGSLLDTDDHRIGADQMLNSGFAESHFFHPPSAVSPGIVKPARAFDEHIQAHQ